MECLMCGTPLRQEGSLSEILFREDSLCETCRSSWKRIDDKRKFRGIPIRSTWAYEGGFQTSILQYKELYDEALYPIFLEPVKYQFRFLYHGYTLLLMPSSPNRTAQRGFSHLEKIFSISGLPILDPFEKVLLEDQTGKSHQERRKMITGIRLKKEVVLPKKLLLVDDVYTTGSTILGALSCLNLKDHHIQIYTLSRVGDTLKDEGHNGIINKRFQWRTYGKFSG